MVIVSGARKEARAVDETAWSSRKVSNIGGAAGTAAMPVRGRPRFAPARRPAFVGERP